MFRAGEEPLRCTTGPGLVLTDITGLAESILDSSTEHSIIGCNIDATIVLWNEGARRNYGYEASEVVGRHASILHPPEDVAAGKPQQLFDAAARYGKFEGTVNRIRKSGERFIARVVITPRHDAKGRVIGYVLI